MWVTWGEKIQIQATWAHCVNLALAECQFKVSTVLTLRYEHKNVEQIPHSKLLLSELDIG